jgi:hypothetical protein
MLNLDESRNLLSEIMPEILYPEISIQDLYFGNSNIHPTKKALVGNFHGKEHIYAEPSGKYKLIHHEEVIANTIEFVQSESLKDVYGNPVFEPKMWADGSRMKFTVTFPDALIEIPTPKGKVSVAPRISLINSYDLSKKLQILFEALQLVCSNGMVAYRAIEGTQKRHMIGLDLNKQLSLIQPGIANYPKQIEFWKKLAVLHLTGPEFENFLPLLPFGQRHVDAIMHLDIIGTGGTLFQQYKNNKMNGWEIHNAVTQFLTHSIQSEEVYLDKSMKAEEAFMTLV